MRGILADSNVHGHLVILLRVWQSEDWRDIWESLGISIHTFSELSLPPESPDSLVWNVCQAHDTVLLTANRNRQGPDSLEATIQGQNTAASLPVLTLANPDRVLDDPVYAAEIAVRLLQYFVDIESVRGTGRLYVP